MAEIIGIKSVLGFDLDSLKKDLLFFDKIHIIGLRQLLPNYEFDKEIKIVKPFLDVFIDLLYHQQKVSFESDEDKDLLKEIEWLISNDKLILNERDIIFHRAIKGNLSKSIEEGRIISSYFLDKCKVMLENKKALSPEFILHAHDISTRDKASIFNTRINIEAYPIVNDISMPTEISSKKIDVIRLITQKIPTLDKNIPWDDIFQFKNDEETKLKFLALKNWITDLSSSNFSVSEIEDKIEYAFIEYEKHLQINKMKYQKSLLETIIVNGSELLENIIKLKIGKIAKRFFELKELKINILESEIRAPGKEIAYIHKVKENFGIKPS